MKKQLTIALLLLASYAMADNSPRVISSIYPLQQIANAITGKTTGIIVDSYLSPHDYAIKPSDAKRIKNSDILLWVGDVMMPQLHNFIAQRKTPTITASKLPNIKLIPDNDDDHEGHHDKKHQSHNDELAHFSYNPHIWLDTDNAKTIAKALAQALIKKDPQNRQRYQANLAAFKKELQETKSFIYGQFESNPAPKYFVFHNAYLYFEKEFGIENMGKIRLHANQTPTTKHLNQLRKQLKSVKNACIFKEPQFDSPILDKLVESTDVKVGVLNPIGYKRNTNIGYSQILKNVALQIANCRK